MKPSVLVELLWALMNEKALRDVRFSTLERCVLRHLTSVEPLQASSSIACISNEEGL